MRKYITALIVLGLIEISLALYLTEWRKVFWNFISLKDSHGFIYQLELFTVIALVICFVSAYSTYLTSLVSIKWRESIDEKIRARYNEEV